MKAPRNNNPIPNQPFASNDLPTLKGPYWDVALGSGFGLGNDGNAVTAQGGGGGSLPVHFPPYNCSTDVDTAGIAFFNSAWSNCTGLTSFPGNLNLSSGIYFVNTWSGCTSLTTFPAGMFDSCPATNFDGAWYNCALSQQSVNNILTSINTAGQSNGTLTLIGGTSSAPGPAGLAAKASLQAKGWTVTTN